MSTDYVVRGLTVTMLKESRLLDLGLRYGKDAGNNYFVTDGDGYLWLDIRDQDIIGATRYGLSHVEDIINNLEAEFAASFISEEDPEYWNALDVR